MEAKRNTALGRGAAQLTGGCCVLAEDLPEKISFIVRILENKSSWSFQLRYDTVCPCLCWLRLEMPGAPTRPELGGVQRSWDRGVGPPAAPPTPESWQARETQTPQHEQLFSRAMA